MASGSGIRPAEALTRLGYATGEDVMRAMAEQHGLDFVNLNEVAIPPAVVELVPESVARENIAIPLEAYTKGILRGRHQWRSALESPKLFSMM